MSKEPTSESPEAGRFRAKPAWTKPGFTSYGVDAIRNSVNDIVEDGSFSFGS